MRVYVAVFVYKGVLEGLEVHTDPVRAQARADEWKKQANPEGDVVDVLVEELKGPLTITPADLPVVIKLGETITIEHTGKIPASDEVDGTPLRELGLPKMFYLRLRRAGYEMAEQLCQKTERQLLFHRLIGAKCISLVKEALAKKGLELTEL